jgi:hypothetical protein
MIEGIISMLCMLLLLLGLYFVLSGLLDKRYFELSLGMFLIITSIILIEVLN